MAAITEPFASGDSFIHRLDPRFKLVSAALFTIPTALFTVSKPAWLALAFGLILIKMAKLDMLKVMHRLLVVNVFIAFLWLFLPFSLPGYPLFSIGPFHVTQEGIDLALLITAKSNAIVVALMALLGTIPVQHLGPVLQRLRIPGKLCHILLFTYRYIFVIHQEYTTMRRSMQARGFRPRTDAHTYRTFAWLVGMILVKSWDRAERVQSAMRCRGFKGQFYSLRDFTARTDDFAFLAFTAAVTCGLIYLEFFQGTLS